MNRKIVIGGLVLLALIVLGGFFTPAGQNLGQIDIATTSTNSSSTVGVVAVKILSVNPAAQLRTCTNTGAVPLYVSYNATSTGFTALTGDVLWTSSTGRSYFELSEDNGNLWLGNVWALTNTGTSTVSCTQL